MKFPIFRTPVESAPICDPKPDLLSRKHSSRMVLGLHAPTLMIVSYCCVLLSVGSLVAAPAGGSSAIPVPANGRVAAIQVRVVPDRAGWTYAVGERAKFQVDVTADNETLVGAKIRYSIGPEMLPAEEKTADLPASGLTIEGGTMKEPGFLRCIVTVEIDGKKYRGLATAGFSPEKIQPTQSEPADFETFWNDQKAELAKLPLDTQMTLQPDLGTSSYDVFHVSIQNVGTGPGSRPTRIYGMLCVPKGKGPFPAALRVPGAGVRPYKGWRDAATNGVITLEIGIHGIPVNLPPELYEQLQNGALNDYNVISLDDKERYYYRRVYLGCVRANDFLCSLPQFDGKNLAVIGGSQGGQLSIVTTALDPRVKALGCYYPGYGDVTGYLHGRAGGWPHRMRPATTELRSRHATPDKIATTAYYDTVNFARRVRVPGNYTWGYNDEVCPPTSTFAAYNVITAPKQLLLTLELGHTTIPEQNDKLFRFVLDQLGVKQD